MFQQNLPNTYLSGDSFLPERLLVGFIPVTKTLSRRHDQGRQTITL